MRIYIAILKIIAIIALIPFFFGLIVWIGRFGFFLDWSNVWNANSSGTMYWFVLPFSFIFITGWVVYALIKRRSIHQTKLQETEIRHQLHNDLELGTNNHDIVVNILTKQGSRTAADLSKLLDISEEETLKVIRSLLQSNKIYQDMSYSPPRFNVLPTNVGKHQPRTSDNAEI